MAISRSQFFFPIDGRKYTIAELVFRFDVPYQWEFIYRPEIVLKQRTVASVYYSKNRRCNVSTLALYLTK